MPEHVLNISDVIDVERLTNLKSPGQTSPTGYTGTRLQDGHLFAGAIFKCIFMNEKFFYFD